MAASQLGGNKPLSKIPRFFKILFPDPFAYLKLPHEFYTYLPHELPKRATLYVPGGTNWHVEIHKNDGDVFFGTGWPEFAKAHDLHTGYFLIFRYEGNMVFNITVFDTTCCDKEYARTPVMQSSPEFSDKIEDSSESSDEIGDSSESSDEIQDSTDCRQFEKILNPASLKENDLGMPKKFFIKNGLVEKQTFFSKVQ
ncbi:hypothetical protein LUZ60_008869 [Juncus effusus]|nr:hypothetical protein LUZ60_008869 [Juncus effusus]